MECNAKKRDERDVRSTRSSLEEKRARRVWRAIKHLDCRGTEICRERAAANYDCLQIIYVILILSSP